MYKTNNNKKSIVQTNQNEKCLFESIKTLGHIVWLNHIIVQISYIQVANKEYAAGTSAQITGWGLTNANLNNVPTQLQGATTTLVSLSQCARTWGSSSLTDRMQCAGGQGVNSGCMVNFMVIFKAFKSIKVLKLLFRCFLNFYDFTIIW